MTSRVTSTIPVGSPAAPPCTAIRVIGVRGSTEPQHGSRLLKPIGEALADAFPGQVSYSELEYPATIERFVPPADIDLGESPSIGVANLVALLSQTAGREPGCCFVLLGYSQGAQVVGDALVPPPQRICGQRTGELSQAASDRIVAIALFGDPRFTKGEPYNAGTFDPNEEGLYPRALGALDRYAGRLKNYCARDDVTCQGATGNLQAHTSYFGNTMPAEATTFVIQRIRSKRCLP